MALALHHVTVQPLPVTKATLVETLILLRV